MAYTPIGNVIVPQAIADTSTTQKLPLGRIVMAEDPTLGAAEFIYLKGVAATAVGTPVIYNTANYQTTVAPVGSNKPQPVGFSMSANVASQFGWYQISGNAVAVKTAALALASNVAVGILTAGKVAATGSGKEIIGALTVAKATAAAVVTLVINRPHMQGRVT